MKCSCDLLRSETKIQNSVLIHFLLGTTKTRQNITYPLLQWEYVPWWWLHGCCLLLMCSCLWWRSGVYSVVQCSSTVDRPMSVTVRKCRCLALFRSWWRVRRCWLTYRLTKWPLHYTFIRTLIRSIHWLERRRERLAQKRHRHTCSRPELQKRYLVQYHRNMWY